MFVYPSKVLTNAHVMKTLETYYPPFVDGKNLNPVDMKHKYHGVNGKFFNCEGDQWTMFDLEVVDLMQPTFLVSFDEGTKVSKADWNLVLKWVNTIFSGEKDYELDDKIKKLIPPYEKCPEKITFSTQLEPKCVEDQREYRFRYVVDCDFDRALFEVIKPYTDKPYTAVIRGFSNRGFLPFFTALYVCTSWGVCSQDHAFLEKLWVFMNLDAQHGPLNLEKRLQEDIQRCLPREGYVPEPEPEVYRMSIEEVKGVWAGKRVRDEDNLCVSDTKCHADDTTTECTNVPTAADTDDEQRMNEQ